MTKAVSRVSTNIKPMSGGDPIAHLLPGWYLFGSEGPTDITGFTHIYREDGIKIELGKPCKAWKANLTLSNVEENTDPPPPAERQRAFIQTWNGVEYVTTETWERIE